MSDDLDFYVETIAHLLAQLPKDTPVDVGVQPHMEGRDVSSPLLLFPNPRHLLLIPGPIMDIVEGDEQRIMDLAAKKRAGS